jgi:hypothetical protein
MSFDDAEWSIRLIGPGCSWDQAGVGTFSRTLISSVPKIRCFLCVQFPVLLRMVTGTDVFIASIIRSAHGNLPLS